MTFLILATRDLNAAPLSGDDNEIASALISQYVNTLDQQQNIFKYTRLFRNVGTSAPSVVSGFVLIADFSSDEALQDWLDEFSVLGEDIDGFSGNIAARFNWQVETLAEFSLAYNTDGGGAIRIDCC